jgi:hypothetical protein
VVPFNIVRYQMNNGKFNSRIVGALWKRRDKDGNDYFSGVLKDLSGDIRIAVFNNNRKEENSNQPDMNIVISWGANDIDKPEDEEEEKPKKNGKKEPVKTKDGKEVPF